MLHLKQILYILVLVTLVNCTSKKMAIDSNAIKQQIFDTEKAFEAATKEIGVARAFYEFAAPDAVIQRGGDSVIKGKDAIFEYYKKHEKPNTTVTWTADFIDVSADGTLGYTYGHYEWKIKAENDSVQTLTGIFHTVWKRQPDGTWKYVWD